MQVFFSFALVIALAGVLPTGEADGQEEPYLQMIPEAVASGGVTTAYGSGFCASSGCTPVSITVEGEEGVASVPVQPDGTFQRAITVSQPPGRYQVTAVQISADGSVLRLIAGFRVMVVDRPPPEPTSAPSTTDATGSAPIATPSDLSSAAAATLTAERSEQQTLPTSTSDSQRRADDRDSNLRIWTVVGLTILAVGATGVLIMRRRVR